MVGEPGCCALAPDEECSTPNSVSEPWGAPDFPREKGFSHREERGCDRVEHGKGSGTFWAGAGAVAPLLVGVLPFALMYGVAAVAQGFPPHQAIWMSVLVFAGASQLAALDMIGQQAPIFMVVLTALVVNLRFAMYSASIAGLFSKFSLKRKWLFSYLLTDQAFAVTMTRFRDRESAKYLHLFYLGSALALWLTWQLGTAAGVFVGAQIPAGWSLDFAIPLSFIALLMPNLRRGSEKAAAVAAGVIAVLGTGLPMKSGLIVATFCGIAIGLIWERRG